MQQTLIRSKLISWYGDNKRLLPWRVSKDPYRIWISEVMLQQTTVTAVIPYFERFVKKFPTIIELSKARESQVLKLWAGLGYYSRAKNLHKSSKLIAKSGFPKSYLNLMQLPGFGPYTSRAVSSIAFNEPAGVVDGNVIRLLSRLLNIRSTHWTTLGRKEFQKESDDLANCKTPGDVNQAMMDLGSNICTAHNPKCLQCPLLKHCYSHKNNQIEFLPIKKARKIKELWVWKPEISVENGKIFLQKNHYAPFLRGNWLPPGNAKITKNRPKKFDFKHNITHHEIYVVPRTGTKRLEMKGEWISLAKVPEKNPSSLIGKIISKL